MLTDIAVTPIADTIRQLSAERRSGDLQLRAGRMVKIVFFDHGRLVFAASNLRRDRLGEGLMADGRITPEEFELVSSLMRADKRRFGEALVSAGVMDRYEVGGAVARQVRRIALSLFALQDGVAVFEERECKIPLDYMVSLSVHRLLYDGIRQMKSEALVLRGLGSLDRCVVLAEVPPFGYEPKDNAEETEILELARRRVTVRRLAWAAGGLKLPRMRAAYALLGAGLLQDADAPDAPGPVLQSETGAFLLSSLQKKPQPPAREAIRREIQQELATSARLERDEWLALVRSTGPSELVRVLEQKMDHYHELSDGISPDDSLRGNVETVIGRLASALRVVRRAAEEAATAPPATASPAERPAPRAAEAADAGTETRAALPERPALPFAPPSGVGTETVAAVPPAASATLPGTRKPAPAKLAPEKQAPARAAEQPGARTMNPDQSIRMAPPGSSSFEGQALVEHLLMEGEVRMTVSDYANAVTVYSKLVDLEPRVASHHMKLATAMVCYPRTAKLAEREFYEAARLEPNNSDIHYRWGLYYKMMKVKSRAVAEFRNAVRLNPRHRAARTELELLSPKDSALTSLKKLFR